MKKVFKVILISTLVFIQFNSVFAQNCIDLKELLRKRHKISEMTYGHPYTTFDRHNKNYKTKTIF